MSDLDGPSYELSPQRTLSSQACYRAGKPCGGTKGLAVEIALNRLWRRLLPDVSGHFGPACSEDYVAGAVRNQVNDLRIRRSN